MSAAACSECGFDETRWSDEDVARTLAHAGDLLGYVFEGAADDRDAPTGPGHPHDRSGLDAAHEVMRRLHDAAVARRAVGGFEPMVGTVDSLQASGGGVPKRSIDAAEIESGGLHGDVQGDRRHHGRPWQAICLYSAERIEELRAEGHPIVPGGVGENITIAGVVGPPLVHSPPCSCSTRWRSRLGVL